MRAGFWIFLTVVLAIWSLMHAYVFWRLSSVGWISQHFSIRTLVLIALALWLSYPLARIFSAFGPHAVAYPLEWIGSIWMGVLFLLLSALLCVDMVTAGGWLFVKSAPQIRGIAAIIAAALSLISLLLGLRPPVVSDHEVRLAGLPAEHDGLVLVAISDLHLGTLNGDRWMRRLVERVNGLRPEMIAVLGDILDGRDGHIEGLGAPLGVWAVTGNHEYYRGLDRSVRALQSSGLTVLQDRWEEAAPGLIVAGVDDLTARRQFGEKDGHVERALAGAPPGAVVLLSHSSWEARAAAKAGADLMLSGHTHSGQIWPFNFLVQLRYPLLAGRYDIDGMTVIVCRGTGTWGPPMRLWRPSEILRITLRTAE
jgi:predicted MPP superfamily phosphohydrolase